MTESDWLACNDPSIMLDFLEPRASDRKLQLFTVACCRRACSLSSDPRHHQAVEAAERFAIGDATAADFARILQPVVELWAKFPDDTKGHWKPIHYMTGATRHLGGGGNSRYAASFAARGLACLHGDPKSPPWVAVQEAEESFQSSILRDLFGMSWRPFQFDPVWLAGEGRPAVEWARTIDDEGRFDDLPTMAESLEQAGCRDLVILDHCRGPRPHFRGCWVVDALLGRESAVQMGLITEADWQTSQDPTSLLDFLRQKGTERQWRWFAIACCRRIGHLITDDRSRRAIEVATQHAEGIASDEALEEARAEAGAAWIEAKRAEYTAEAEEDFQITPRYAAVSRNFFAVQAARSAVSRDPRKTDADPETFEARRWMPSHESAAAVGSRDVFARRIVDDQAPDVEPDQSPRIIERESPVFRSTWEEAEESAKAIEASELRVQSDILRDLFGEFLGPPGDVVRWIPCGKAGPTSEWWCRLPTLRSLVVRSEWKEWSDGAIPRLARAIHAEERFDDLPLLADALEEAGCQDPTILDHLRGGGPHFRGCWVLERLMGRELPSDPG